MKELLRKMGLNKYETSAYIALVRVSYSSAFQLSKKSGVPFGRIYDALKNLEIMGLVEVVPTKPKKYKAVKPEHALNGLIDDKLNTLEKLRSKIKEGVKNIGTEETSEDLVSVTTGKSNFAKKVSEHFNYNHEFWATSEGFKLQEWYPSIKRKFKGDTSRRYILTDGLKANNKHIKDALKSGVNVRHYPLEGVRFLISDEELITISIQDPNKEWVNIHVRNHYLGKALTSLLKNAWKNANKVS